MKKLLLLLSLCLPVLMSADNVTPQRAQKIAEEFFSASMPATRSNAASLKLIWDGEDGMTKSSSAPAYYVFNNEAGKGFVIVSGDECTESPILGYSFDQNFDAENMPYNLRTWMKGIKGDILKARASGPVEANSNWTAFQHNPKTPVVLLQTPLWDQRAPYNGKLPYGEVTGCPATAISIIMRYHKWPEKGVGTIPAWTEGKLPAVTLGHTYDWDQMPFSYTGATEYQNSQVATLMRDVGYMIRTQYRGGSAGANPETTLPQLMPIYMRYNKNTIKSYFKANFSDSEWHKMMQKELDGKRPILYGGYSSGGGHQFVLDGYAEGNYYHVNWGWSGVSNGYYLLTGMNPPEQGAGGSSSQDGFTRKQDAIIGIQPDPTNPGGGAFDLITYVPQRKGDSYGMITSETSFAQGKQFQIVLKEIRNAGTRDFGGRIAVGHFSADGVLKSIISNEVNFGVYTVEINGTTYPTLRCNIKDAIEAGDKLYGVFKHISPYEWTIIRNGGTDTKCIEEIVLSDDVAPTPPEPTNDLADHVSLKFDKASGSLLVITKSEDSVKLELADNTGKDCTADHCKKTDNGFEIRTSGMTGNYTIKLSSAKRGNAEIAVGF